MQLLKAGERGVEVCLVENFATGYPVAFDGQEVDRPPLGVEALLRGPMALMGYDRPETVEPMHRLDVDLQGWREVPNRAEGLGHGAGREWGSSPVVDGYPVRRGKFVPVECGVATGDHRPCVSVGGCFAGEVSGIKLRESGFQVLGVEPDARHHPIVGVDFNNRRAPRC